MKTVTLSEKEIKLLILLIDNKIKDLKTMAAYAPETARELEPFYKNLSSKFYNEINT